MTTFLTRKIPTRAAIAIAVLALLASLVSGRERSDVAVTAIESNAPAAVTVAELDPAKIARQPAPQQPVADLFAPPAPPAPPAYQQQEAKPTAPPLPFRYLGRATIEEGRIVVFLERGNQNFSVAQGERAGSEYRIEQITDASVTLTYLPLGQQQTLAVPARN